jgi:anthranilate phosphoribosyltransferase
MSSSRNHVVADANESRAKILEVLDNKPGVARDIVMLNSGAALYTAGLAASIAEGVAKARESIASGAARARLDQFIKTTQRLKA